MKCELAELKRSSRAQIGEMQDRHQAIEAEAKKQETRVVSFTRKWERVLVELKERRPEKEVLDDFRKSDTYSQELATAAAKKIHQCWLIAEKHIQTDPEPSWEKLCPLFVEVEEAAMKDEEVKNADKSGA